MKPEKSRAGLSLIWGNLHNRFILLITFTVVFILLNWFFTGSLLPSTETKNMWFYSGIFMVLFSMLFIEPYYSSPKNVITNVVPLLLVFLAIHNGFENLVFWWAFVAFLSVILVASIISMALSDSNKSPDNLKNKVSEFLRSCAVLVGQGKVLYSCVFIYFLLTYYSIQTTYTLILFILWFFVVIINPKKISSTFSGAQSERGKNAIGEIFGVQSKKIFLVKLFDDRKGILKFDIVMFRYSMQDTDKTITGIVFDTYLLNQEKWAKILQLGTIEKSTAVLEKNTVYKISDEQDCKKFEKKMNIDRFVGIIIEGSKIGKIKFEYSKKVDDLQEGDLIELKSGPKRLFYQVINGTTAKESLEQRNEMGFIEGEAIQLGEWCNEELSFQKFGWVPAINTPIFKADTSDIKVMPYEYPEFKLGTIPGTTLPSIFNLSEAVSHHSAVLGVTGSGKSFLVREIISQLLIDTKVICVDFTGEWKKELNILGKEAVVLDNTDNLADFFAGEKSIGIVELPTMSNTEKVIESTEILFASIFDFAKKKYDQDDAIKIALVLEEAHTIVPETSFLGVNSFDSKALVNKMGQIALQGRKHGIGMLVIAQRTANVSKTILTQCNTVICFQAFDETSFAFLGNYIGKDLVQTLPNLKQYHAVVTGKAVRSNLPMIIDLERKAIKISSGSSGSSDSSGNSEPSSDAEFGAESV